MQEKSREQARKHKSELEKKDSKREKDLARARKRKVAAVKDATRKVERRLAQSQTASRRHWETMEVRLPFLPFVRLSFLPLLESHPPLSSSGHSRVADEGEGVGLGESPRGVVP